MCRKLIFLSSFVLVVALVGHASGGTQASNPNPATGATGVDQNPTLSWTPGDLAVFHDVYFGTNLSVLPLVSSRQMPNSYTPGSLSLCKTYYWRIDEVNDLEPNSPWIGSIWYFKTTCSENDSNVCVSPPLGVVAWWPLDETVGDTSEDIAGDNDGTWMGAPTPVAGKVAGALGLNGVTDYVEVPDALELDFGTGDFSIDAWIRIDNNTANYALIVDKRNYNAVGYEFLVFSGKPLIGLGDADGWNIFYNPASADLRDGKWHFVAVTVDRNDPNGGKLYCDCNLIHMFNPTVRDGDLSNSAALWIGRHHPNYLDNRDLWFDGAIDEVELFNRVLTAGEIQSICQAGSAGKCKCMKPQTYPDDIKWSQPPDYRPLGCINGWDEKSVYYDPTGPIVADDWICMDGRPITNIHWWGSFKGWTEPNNEPPYDMPSAFHIGIWTNVRKSPTNTFSHPDQLIWENICDSFVWSYAGCDVDPRNINGIDTCFQFDQLLSQDKWFYQHGNEPNGGVYWLSISAIYDGTPVHPWGWKTRPHFYSDDAVRILIPDKVCPDDCNNPDYSEFSAGIGFPDPNAHPSNDVLQHLGQTPRNFGETLNNQRFGHTFTGLPDCIVAAQLEIYMRATGDIPSTDSLGFEVLNASSHQGGWGKPIIDLPLTPGGPPIGSWNVNDANLFVFDLNNLPPYGPSGVTSVLEYMKDHKLDVYLQDDTEIDWMILHVWSCPKVAGPWPPTVGSFYQNGQAIEYPTGTSWDTAFVLTTNRMYTPRRGYWPSTTSDSDAASITAPPSQLDFDDDLIVNFKDFSVFAEQWLTEGFIWPEFIDE